VPCPPRHPVGCEAGTGELCVYIAGNISLQGTNGKAQWTRLRNCHLASLRPVRAINALALPIAPGKTVDIPCG